MTQIIFAFLHGFAFFALASGNLNTCPEFPPPKHGHMICDHLLGKYCTPSCNAGFEPASVPAWAYVCNPVTRRWATYPESYPLPWPNCVPKRKVSNREHFILQNLFNPMTNEVSRKQLSDILYQNNVRDDTQSLDIERYSPAFPSHGDKKDNVDQKESQPLTSKKDEPKKEDSKPLEIKTPDLKAVDSKLLQNTSNTLSYQVTEHHEDNRTMTSKVDMTNVTSSLIGNQKELDVENVTISTSRANVPSSVKNIPLAKLKLDEKSINKKDNTHSNDADNDPKSDDKKDRIQASDSGSKISGNPKIIENQNKKPVKAAKKQYVQYANQYPNTMESNNITNLLNEEVFNATRLGEEAFNNSVMAVWGEYYKNFYKTYAKDNEAYMNNTKQKEKEEIPQYPETTLAPIIETPITETPLVETPTVTKKDNPENTQCVQEPCSSLLTDTINRTVDAIAPNSTNPLGVVVVVVDEPRTNNSLTYSANLSSLKSAEHMMRQPSAANSTIINININSININISDSQANTLENLKNLKFVASTLTDDPSLDDISTKNIRRKSKKNKEKKNNDENDKDKNKSNFESTSDDDGQDESENKVSTTASTNTTTTTTTTKAPPTIETTKNSDPSTTHKYEIFMKDAEKEAMQKSDAAGNVVDVRTFIKKAGEITEVPNVTAKFMVTKGDPPLVPVFSDKDLSLLRQMVETPVTNSNTKRSELKRSVSSLWSKMLTLSSNRDIHSLQMPRLGSSKELAVKDSSIAKLIMSDINKRLGYHFKQTQNPYLTAKLHQALHSTKMTDQNPSARQYVWNGATYVPATGDGPLSYLNSNTGGGLSKKSRYRWNGATYVPNEDFQEDDSATTPSVSESTPTLIFNPEVDSKPFAEATQSVETTTAPAVSPPTINGSPESNKLPSLSEIVGILFYWDGSKFIQIMPDTHVKPEEIIYRKGEMGMEPINYSFKSENRTSISQINDFLSKNDLDPLISRWESTTPSPSEAHKTEYELQQSSSVSTTTTPPISNAILSNYPEKPPSIFEIKDLNDKLVAGDPIGPETTSKPFVDETKIPDVFKAPVVYPTQFPEKEVETTQRHLKNDTHAAVEKQHTNEESTTASTITTTTISTITTTTTPPTPPIIETTHIESPMVANTTIASTPTSSTITITTTILYSTTSNQPPSHLNQSNYILPPPDPTVSQASNIPSISIQASEPPQNNTYPFLPTNTTLQDLKKYTENLPKINSVSSNPYKEDSENLENVLATDLNLKQAIESLTNIYENSSDSTPVNIPITHTGHTTDIRLLPPVFGPFHPTNNPKLEHDPTNRQIENNALLQMQPTVVKTNENISSANTEKLKADLQREEAGISTPYSNGNLKPAELADALQKSIAETQVSYTRPSYYPPFIETNKSVETQSLTSTPTGKNENLTANDESNILSSLSGNAKSDLEQTLQSDIEKLETGKIGDDSDADLLTLASADSSNDGSEKDDNTPLSVADIRALLQLTKLAEKESFSKKQGLEYPRITRARALRLLRKPSIKRLVRLLVRKRLSPKIITMLKHRKMAEMKHQLLNNLSKRILDRKRNEALKKLVNIWNKKYQYLRARNNTYPYNVKVNPLPRFGKRSVIIKGDA